MATAPYQLWMDLAPVASAVRVSSTVTITTSSPHAITTGAYIQVGDTTGTAGTSMVGVYQVTVTSGTTFTYSSAGSAGTADSGSAFIAFDLLNPPINYASGTARSNAMIVDISTLNLSANGDGSGSTMRFDVLQEQTPAAGPWFTLVPDNTRLRLVYKDTGSAPAANASDVYFLGLLDGLDARLNGSGQGTTTTVSLGDANVVLDRVAVFGKTGSSRLIGLASRSGNVATYYTTVAHGFVNGQTVKVTGVLSSGTATFNGTYTISSVTTTSFTATNTGSDQSSSDSVTAAFSRDGRSNDWVVVTAVGTGAKFYIESGDTVRIRRGSLTGFGDATTMRLRLDNTFSGGDVVKISDASFKVRLARPYTFTWGTFGNGSVFSQGIVRDPTQQPGQVTVTIPGGLTEADAVKSLLTTVNQYKAADYPLQRVMSTSGTAAIIGGTAYDNGAAIQFASCSLRSALDTVIETYGGGDVKERRYYVDLAGKLNYRLVDAESKPTYATAPYAIVTSGAGTPNTTTGKATVAPFDLSVNWDHGTTKNAQFTLPASGSGAPLTTVLAYTDMYTDEGNRAFTTRGGAPVFDDVVDFPGASNHQGAQIKRAAAAYFIERHKPMLSGQFTLRGAGTAAHNANGFSAGYAQTGASTYALVNRWEPGQWVEITSAGLGLSGLYRVEQVDWSLEPGSYVQIIRITFNRRNPSDLPSLIANLRK